MSHKKYPCQGMEYFLRHIPVAFQGANPFFVTFIPWIARGSICQISLLLLGKISGHAPGGHGVLSFEPCSNVLGTPPIRESA